MTDNHNTPAAKRARIAASFVMPIAPHDAVAFHYGVEHDLQRCKLFLSDTSATGTPDAWIAICQTGMDLFRPLVVIGARDASRVAGLLQSALTPNRQYLLSAAASLLEPITQACHLHGEQINRIYSLEQGDFIPVINILVQGSMTPDGKLRATIRARDGAAAAEAGTNWQGAQYAELFVQVQEGARLRGLGKSVVSAVCAQLLAMSRRPILLVGEQNIGSQRLATSIGFRYTGATELTGAINL